MLELRFPLALATACALSTTTSAATLAAPPRGDEGASEENEPRDDKEIVWANVDLGMQTAHLRTFEADADLLTAGFARTASTGPMGDVGLGLRFSVVTIGARARMASFPGTETTDRWMMSSVDAELGLRIPIGALEPHAVLGAGYTTLGGLGQAVVGLKNGLDVDGANVRGGLGVDIYVTRHLSIGALLSGEVLALSRSGVPLRELTTAKKVGTLDEAEARVLEADGSSLGTALTFGGGLGTPLLILALSSRRG